MKGIEKNMKKTCSVLLILAMLSALLASCGGEAGPAAPSSSVDTAAADTTAEIVTTAELTTEQKLAAYLESLEKVDYNGYEFYILTREESASPSWFTRDVYSEGLDGEPINDAIYERNRTMEEKFNVVIRDNPQGSKPSDAAKKLITAGEDSFGAVTDGLASLASLATSGYLIDYNTLKNIKLENEWWDQNMNSELSILHRLYFVTGDISMMDNEGTWHMLFNKDLQKDYGLADYYALRDAGTWTLDILHADTVKTSKDIDGDGKMTPEVDQFGLATEDYNAFSLWVGSGEKVVTKNDQDIPELTLYNERSEAVLNKVLDLNANKEISLDHNLVHHIFGTGLIMFQLVGMRVLPVYRQYDVDFGILPIPKYNEQQDDYYSTFSAYNLTAYSLPMTSADAERSANILEIMAGISYYTLTPAYYDISLTGKYLRDDESTTSMEIILSKRSYDLGVVYNWGGATGLFQDMNKANSRDFASRYAKFESAALAAMNQFLDTLK